MNTTPGQTTWLHAACVLAALSIASHGASGETPLARPPGGVMVHVTHAGAPVAGATVCIGTPSAANLFFQNTTDRQGNVRFGSVPHEPFVVTASVSGRGASRSFSPVPKVSVLRVNLELPADGGPLCPSIRPDSTLNRPRIRDLPVTTPVTPVPSMSAERKE